MKIRNLNEDTFDAKLKKELNKTADLINADEAIPETETDEVFQELDDALRIAL